MEQRIDVLKAVYQGAYNKQKIAHVAGMSDAVAKRLVLSLSKKGYLGLAPRGENGKSKHLRGYGKRRWSWLNIIITDDGKRVLDDARKIKRQLLDEEIDWR